MTFEQNIFHFNNRVKKMSMDMVIPKVVKVLQEKGAISDELDFAIFQYLLNKRGPGYTACQPKLVELDGGMQAIQIDIDNTFIDKNNQIMGLGIVGTIFVDVESLQVLYCTPAEELEKNITKLKIAGIGPQVRPHGKY